MCEYISTDDGNDDDDDLLMVPMWVLSQTVCRFLLHLRDIPLNLVCYCLMPVEAQGQISSLTDEIAAKGEDNIRQQVGISTLSSALIL